MPLRMIELIAPAGSGERIEELLEKNEVLSFWYLPVDEERMLARIILPTEQTESALDILDTHLAHTEDFRMVLTSVEATVPRPEPKEEPEPGESEGTEEAAAEQQKAADRLSREELYADVEVATRLTGSYLIMVVLSSIVAAIGILKNNVAIVIGAMVIAPLLGPNMALSLATALGDAPLAKRSVKTNVIGISLALALTVLLGVLLEVDPSIPEVASRTRVGLGDIALALAAGAAGTLAFTKGLSGALVGVMVAVALLPPLVTVGLLVGAARWPQAFGAALLLTANLICINLAGVASFFAQGIRPGSWWEAKQAKKATRDAILIWTLLLLLLVAVIYFSETY